MKTDTKFHEAGDVSKYSERCVTLWDIYQQQWFTTSTVPSDRIMATLSDSEREAIKEHLS